MQEKTIYGCSVVLSDDMVLNFSGHKEEIAEKLKFIRNSILDLRTNDMDEEDCYKFPVILTEQDDVSVPAVFYLKDYEENI